ncbi:MAG: flagellar hook-basal body complex protein FliE [Planctomycetes bacterium]|nr:flagellar hook-basal body complex protein FliE [Planctomycetota bacterium]
MPLDGIGGVGAFSHGDFVRGLTESSKDASGAKFTQLLEGLVQDANTAQKHSEALVQGLARGEPVDSHQVITALTEADLSFRTLLEVRTRLIEAYQEIQRMQV